jgi:tetratricopeptide (TPR) repeat protein
MVGWDGSIRYLFAESLRRLGRFDEAAEQAEAAAAYPERRAEALIMLAQLRLRAGRLELARAAAEAAAKAAPGEATPLLVLAKVARADGEMSERIELLEKASALEPTNPTVRTALGSAYLDDGRFAEGQRELAGVLARDPQHLGAAAALLRPLITSPRKRRRLLLAFRIAPLTVALAAGLAAWILGGYVESWAFYGFVITLGTLTIATRAFERQRTDPSVSRIRAQAARRLRERSRGPVGRWAPWSLIVIGLGALVGAVPAIVLEPTQRVRIGLVPTLGFGALLFILGIRLFRHARPRRRKQPRLEPEACRCHELHRIAGVSAGAYAQCHLQPDVLLTGDGIERRHCSLLDVRWVLFPVGAGPSMQELPLLVRIPFGVDLPDLVDDQRPGVYL